MIRFVYLSFMCMFFIKAPAFSQTPSFSQVPAFSQGPDRSQTSSALHPSFSPSIQIPQGLSSTIFYGGDKELERINCYTVLYNMPGYQNAQAQGACYEAQTACLRLGLLQQFLQKQKRNQFTQLYPGGSFSEKELKEHLRTTVVNAKVKLLGCVLAAAASLVEDSVIDQAGFVPPDANKSQKAEEFISAPLISVETGSSTSSSDSSLEPLPQEQDVLPSLDESSEQKEEPQRPPQPI